MFPDSVNSSIIGFGNTGVPFAYEETIFLVDPVMGDNGRVFDIYSDKLRNGMIEMLKSADITTLNLTEACLLADMSYEKLRNCREKQEYLKRVEEVGMKICQLGKKKLTAVISGVKFTESGAGKVTVGNYAICGKEKI